MKTNKSMRVLWASAISTGCLAALVAAPTTAFAAADASILIPKPAEFIPALIAFLVIWFVLAKFAWPMILKNLDARQAKIKGDLDEADAAKQKAAEDLRTYEEKIADAQREADEIIADAKHTAEQSRSQIIAKAQADAADIISKAHEAVETERRTAMSSLTGEVADLSVEMAGRIIDEKLDDATQRKLVEKYLTEAGSLNGK
ncbi:MAG: F0F1 ATP synthase subunit B [Atopobiaceae bacterium]|jgi:F-type H+-transporting ATPase subunit b|nr:F0F1 ATP synthase subunit B [Atopobiaceae bacterium]MCI2173557.1 F0F1 ATP synthase subunit B [Atopobiaceae bacterium]MCI2207801.1 F0F1 ATP synthase subunit B [Atopobiaceae bacterium]